MLHLWIEHDLLSSSQFQQIQACVDSMVVPSDVGRTPRKIHTGFYGYTAESIAELSSFLSFIIGILPRQYLVCWQYLVLACRILCKHCLSMNDISLADVLLMQFVQYTRYVENFLSYTHAWPSE